MLETATEQAVFTEALGGLLLVGGPLDKCVLCGELIPAHGPPLCPECLADDAAKWDDYRAEREQARRPF